jgi:hypothetical protein
MKKITFVYLLALCAGSLMICSYAGGASSHNIEGTGAETGLGNSAGCGTGCHTSATTTTIALELDSAGISTTRYVAGMTYTVKLTGKNTSTTSLPKFGFQIGSIVGASAVAAPVNAGTWKAPFPASTKYVAPKAGQFVVGVVEQTAAIAATSGTGGNGTTYVETFNWTAPASGTGTISFWAALNAVNGNGSDTGDKYNTGHISITEMVASPLKAAASAVNVKCNGAKTGSATVTVTGGSSPYTYSWNSTPVQTASTATNLAAGSYTVTIKDAQGATTTAVAIVTEPTAISVSVTPANVTCNGATDGTATATVSGGTAPYAYSWNNGKTTAAVTGLASGTYTLTVTDANSCIKTATVTINQPPVLTVTVTKTDANCNTSNGSATASASGGTGAYTYAWSNGQTTTSINGLTANTYTVTVTDAKGCKATGTASVNNTGAPTLSVKSTNVTGCFGGTNGNATVTATGGTGTLTYSWNTSPVQTTPTATNLPAGIYTVTVTDASNCFSKSTVTIIQPAQLLVPTTPTNASSCTASDGSITTNVSGGTSPYTYAWSNGKTTAAISGLVTGTYSLTVTDANNCKQSTTADVSCSSGTLTVTVNGVNVKCFGGNDGSATAVASGTPPYTYSWNTTPVQTSATAVGLTAGSYTVTVKDATSSTKTATVVITSPAALGTPVFSVTNASSCSASDGSISATIKGGTPPYTYSWNNGSTSSTMSGLSVGTYTLTVTDANGCKIVSTSAVSFSGVIPIGISTPLKEGFENSTNLPAGWTLDNPEFDAAWQVVTTVAHTGTNSIGFDNCDGNGKGSDMTGTKDRFITAAYDFSNATTSASLSFDLAYAVLKYKNQTLSDSLAVYYSTDCGSTWNQLYLKGGAELSGITTSVSCWTPTDADWKTETIGLGKLAGKPNVMFEFENRSNWGEWIYIDNINITAVTGIEEINPLSTFRIYPNPASTVFNIEGKNDRSGKIHYTLYNALGLEIKAGDIETNGGLFNEKIQVNDFPKGMYFIKLSDKKNAWTRKLNLE